MSGPILERLQRAHTRPRITGVRVGWVLAVPRKRGVLVDFPGNPYGPIQARLTASVSRTWLRQTVETESPVLLTFDDNDPARPIRFERLQTWWRGEMHPVSPKQTGAEGMEKGRAFLQSDQTVGGSPGEDPRRRVAPA